MFAKSLSNLDITNHHYFGSNIHPLCFLDKLLTLLHSHSFHVNEVNEFLLQWNGNQSGISGEWHLFSTEIQDFSTPSSIWRSNPVFFGILGDWKRTDDQLSRNRLHVIRPMILCTEGSTNLATSPSVPAPDLSVRRSHQSALEISRYVLSLHSQVLFSPESWYTPLHTPESLSTYIRMKSSETCFYWQCSHFTIQQQFIQLMAYLIPSENSNGVAHLATS
jgi:hypothetical protein